jgi:Short C-terminal domain
VANNPLRESRRADAFARAQAAFPLPISMKDLELPDGARLDEDEFVVRTSKDWGLSIKSLLLTTRRLFCPSDLTGRSTVSLPLNDVLGVTLQKHMIGFSTIIVDTRDQPQAASFPAHINGQLVRSDIAAAVDYAKRSVALDPSTAASSYPSGDRYDQLRKISELKQSGTLTEAEFEEEKARILRQP